MATILEGLNKLSGALGGAETATENLEALNAIAGALGGETTATSNADAIDQIAEHASGGGGSSDFSTAEVTITNNSSAGVDLMAAHTYTDETESVSNGMIQISPSETKTITAILYKDGCGYSIEGADLSTISCALTGDIEPTPFSNMIGKIQGNGTMTLTDKA